MSNGKDYKLVIAILIVAIVWGTTYLGIRIAVESIPPWFVTGIRQSIAGVLLLIILGFRKQFRWIGWRNFKNQILLSTLMLIIANGFTTIAEKHITSSLTSLLTATSPMIVFLGSVFIGLQKFNYKSLLGIILGFSGVLLIFWEGLQDLLNPNFRFGIGILFIGILGWSFGTIYSKKISVDSSNILLNLFYQFSFAGIVQLIFAFVFTQNYNFENWTARSFLAVVYLGVFGSVITFVAFLYALKKILPSQISILNYVNTVIAIFLGWLVLDETITVKFLIATLLIILGVFITNYNKDMFRKSKT